MEWLMRSQNGAHERRSTTERPRCGGGTVRESRISAVVAKKKVKRCVAKKGGVNRNFCSVGQGKRGGGMPLGA